MTDKILNNLTLIHFTKQKRKNIWCGVWGCRDPNIYFSHSVLDTESVSLMSYSLNNLITYSLIARDSSVKASE